MKKIKLLITTFALALFIVPVIGHAEYEDATEVGTFAELVAAVENGGDIKLTADITVERPIIVTKDTTIYGDDFTLDGTGMVRDGSNGSIITAMPEATLYLWDMTIKNANKYGIQAYNTGIVAVDGVTITDCTFGAILVNGGGLVVGDLTMGNNGEHEGGNGIEMGKGNASLEDPVIVMVGEITLLPGDQTTAIFLAENDALETVEFANYEGATNTLAFENNKLVIKGANNQVKYESNVAKEGLTLTEASLEDIPEIPEQIKPTPNPKPEQPANTPDNTITENPNTYDGILVYIVLAITGLGILTLSFKKAFNK